MRRRVLAGLTVVAALLSAAPAAAQSVPVSLTGQLLDQATHAPIRAGVVQIGKSQRRVLTDSLGRFGFPDVRAGTYVLVASALGYRQNMAAAQPGTPIELLLEPEPVALAAIRVVTRSRTGVFGGATVRVFGRDELLANGKLPAAQFVRYYAHFQTRLCRVREPTGMPVLPYLSQGLAGGTDSAVEPGVPEGVVRSCIVGAGGRAGPFMVRVDDHPLTDPDELWAYPSWELGRVEVVFQRSGVGGAFAIVHLYTVPYLARVGPRLGNVCAGLAGAGSARDSALAALCGP